ncbi:hypothetical protein ABFX02_06G107500 [Erythranthe guttata]
METTTCDVNHLEADALLPPRKRLLAGLKRQNSDVNSPPPGTAIVAGSKNYVHLNNPFKSQLINPNLSNEEIVEASRIAATEAAKVAKAARANAEEKAAKAAKAVAAAKTALDLVATLSDEVAVEEKHLKKNKMKKQVPVETLYNKNKGKNTTNCRTDEELARKLHQAINSSPRILKNSSDSVVKNHKHKRLKSSADTTTTTTSSGHGAVGEVDTEGPVIKKIDTIMVDLSTPKHDKGDRLKFENNEVLDSYGKKRGRMKQKKLPLSICSSKDQSGPKEELKLRGAPLLEDNQTLFQMGPSDINLLPVERASMWKCQTFKAPVCVKQNKVMQL